MSSDQGAAAASDGPGRRPRADAQRNRARILAAAEAVFARDGAAGSTEQVAAEAGVAIGTVFRHFPTKLDLLREVMKDAAQRLRAEAETSAADGDPETALFEFFRRFVAQAANKQTVIGLLADSGIRVSVGESVHGLRPQIATLLANAQQAGSVRADVELDAVVALVSAACQGALHEAWDDRTQAAALAVIFDGLRAHAA